MKQAIFSKNHAIIVIIIICIVAISGFLLWKYWQIKTPEDKISGWKTYRNERYGFEVKYPENWEYAIWLNEHYDGETGANFYNPEFPLSYPDISTAPDARPGVIMVGYFPTDTMGTVHSPQEAEELISHLMGGKGEEIQVGGSYKGKIAKSPGSILVLFNVGTKIYEITMFGRHQIETEEKRKNTEEIFNNIIKSFKVIE